MPTNPAGQSIVLSHPINDLGLKLKQAMEQQSVSIRQLSRATEISAPTISRIIAGKQAAGVYHLQMFAEHLHLPIESLLEAMGVTNLKQPAYCESAVFSTLQEIFADCRIDLVSLTEDILKELNKLEQFARTREGKKTILESFMPKIQEMDSMGPIINKLQQFYEQFCSTEITEEQRAAIGSALLYFIWTAEVIPDYLYPIGHLDDAIAVTLVEKKLLNMEGVNQR